MPDQEGHQPGSELSDLDYPALGARGCLLYHVSEGILVLGLARF